MDDTASSITELHIRDADLAKPPVQPVEEVQAHATDGEQDPAVWNNSETRDASVPGSVQEYNARRCHICGVKFPLFGFGPKLTRTGTTLWACSAHRFEVERQLTGAHRSAMCKDEQPSLL